MAVKEVYYNFPDSVDFKVKQLPICPSCAHEEGLRLFMVESDSERICRKCGTVKLK